MRQSPKRQIFFRNLSNFRDLGGYVTADGRRVRHGLLYRSAEITNLSDLEDRAKLDGLGLKLILDLRSRGECEESPDEIPCGTRYLQVSAMYYEDGAELDFSPGGMEKMEQIRNDGSLSKAEFFAGLYSRMPFDNPAFRALFRELETGTVPLLFHCSAGKDRTGVAAMLILLALGATPETALEDYMLTNQCVQGELDALLQENADLIARYPEEKDRLVGRTLVFRENAEKTLWAIIQRYHNFENYFQQEYGITRDRLVALRNRFLEHPV